MVKKPKKTVYGKKKQEEIYKHLKKKLKGIFDSDERIKEMWIYGSALRKQFGKYVKTYKPGTPTARIRSDVDIAFLFEKLPENKEITLKSGHHLKHGFIKDGNGKIVLWTSIH